METYARLIFFLRRLSIAFVPFRKSLDVGKATDFESMPSIERMVVHCGQS